LGKKLKLKILEKINGCCEVLECNKGLIDATNKADYDILISSLVVLQDFPYN